MQNKLVTFWWLLALLFPVGAVWVPAFIRIPPAFLLGEIFPLVMASIFVAAPFAIIPIWFEKEFKSGDPKTRRAADISGFTVLILSSTFCGLLLYDVFTRRSGGADIGAGLLLCASPVVLPIIMLVVFQILKRTISVRIR